MHRLERGCGLASRPLSLSHLSQPKRRLDVCALDAIEAAQKRAPRREPFNLRGAAYRIRTYDVLIRSQTLYPAEVTPRLVDYYAQRLNNGQAFFRKKLSNWIFTHLSHSTRSSMHRDIRKASVAGGFNFNWCGV